MLLVLIGVEHLKHVPATQSGTAVTATNASHASVDAKSIKPVPQIQHSWLDFIATPLYQLLRSLHTYLGTGAYSWGWTIILFTCIFNLCILPLRLSTLKSSQKMMRIRPKVETINKKYADLKMNDPKKAEKQTEMMALYKSEGVKLYSSCLPMLIPMPLFIAMYRVLANAVEFRHARWYWLIDLAAPDPWHILPVLILITMFLTQWITPQPGAEAMQRRMMLFLIPVIMGVTMWRLSSGLSLYWATGNLISLGVQLAINKSRYSLITQSNKRR